ncbi:hypothetical protein EIK77_010288 [Talaromyces pinophilus]|nr:hypothetical protein EIK77_010288 [Talaromyces pinophilus]
MKSKLRQVEHGNNALHIQTRSSSHHGFDTPDSIASLKDQAGTGSKKNAGRVVNTTKYCWRSIKMSSKPATTKVTIVRLSFQAQIEPAKVRAIAKDTIAPVPPIKPTQSRALSLEKTEVFGAPGGFTGGR